YLVQGVDEVVEAADVQERFLLSGERGIGKVLGRCRGAHGDAYVTAVAHCLPRGTKLVAQPLGKRRLDDPSPDRAAGGSQGLDVVDIQVAKLLVDAPVQAGAREEIPIGLRRGRESAGDAHPDLPELSDHLPQGCVLAADHVDVLHPKVLQIDDVRIHLKQAPSQVRRALHDNESNPFYTAAVEVHSRGTASCTARAQEAFQMSERTVFFLSDQTGVT